MSSEPRRSRKKAAEQKAEGVLKEAEKEAEKVAVAVKREVKKVEGSAKKAGSPKASLARPKGRAPEAMVMSRHGTAMVARRGRGFSLGEMSGAGIPPRMADAWGVSVDARRRSVIEANVSALKEWHSHPPTASAVKKEAKVAEVVEEVEKGAAAVVKEASKAEKAVKKGSKKAEGAVKVKAEKPKTRKKKESD